MAKKNLTERRKHRYKGKVGVRSHQGKLSLRLPRAVFDGQQKIVSLGMDDNPENRDKANLKAAEIELDIEKGDFDRTLVRYGLTLKSPHPNPRVEPFPPKITLHEIYEAYISSRQGLVKPSTWHVHYQGTLKRLSNTPFWNIPIMSIPDQAYLMQDWAIANWAPDTARYFFVQLNASFNWAVERGMVEGSQSPFEGFPGKIRKLKKNKRPINPFTATERDAIIQAFQQSERYHYYYNYVRFCFFTGCRPSEALGLEWDDIAPNLSWIRFHQSIVNAEGKQLWSEGLKSQDSRIFPCNEQLKNVLLDIDIRKRAESKSKNLFLKKDGKLISIQAFRRAWTKIITDLPIAYRSPYHTRHTFITLCLERGMEVKDVAHLVGNSPKIIYEHYAGVQTNIKVPIF